MRKRGAKFSRSANGGPLERLRVAGRISDKDRVGLLVISRMALEMLRVGTDNDDHIHTILAAFHMARIFCDIGLWPSHATTIDNGMLALNACYERTYGARVWAPTPEEWAAMAYAMNVYDSQYEVLTYGQLQTAWSESQRMIEAGTLAGVGATLVSDS